ncbi:MAG TPA: hypothetical protein VKV39_06160 [Candidatus Sulfotelmatobacter sp.]|nr:hypothetical protein [Candidatus Sulfotelmatobacter sp.]
MHPLRALLQTRNDGVRLGRCLETLYPCEEIVIVDHGSSDDTLHIARLYGCTVIRAGLNPSSELLHQLISPLVGSGWTLCLEPCESLSEGLAASLFDWKLGGETSLAGPPRSAFLREETNAGWTEKSLAQVRLIPPGWNRWERQMPGHDESSVPLEGALLRFTYP